LILSGCLDVLLALFAGGVGGGGRHWASMPLAIRMEIDRDTILLKRHRVGIDVPEKALERGAGRHASEMRRAPETYRTIAAGERPWCYASPAIALPIAMTFDVADRSRQLRDGLAQGLDCVLGPLGFELLFSNLALGLLDLASKSGIGRAKRLDALWVGPNEVIVKQHKHPEALKIIESPQPLFFSSRSRIRRKACRIPQKEGRSGTAIGVVAHKILERCVNLCLTHADPDEEDRITCEQDAETMLKLIFEQIVTAIELVIIANVEDQLLGSVGASVKVQNMPIDVGGARCELD